MTDNLIFLAIACFFALGCVLGYVWAQETRKAKERRLDDRIMALGEHFIDYYRSKMSLEETMKRYELPAVRSAIARLQGRIDGQFAKKSDS